MAVAVMLLGDLLQHPVTPVQNAAKIATKAMMNKAIIDLPMSVIEEKIAVLVYGFVCYTFNGGFVLFNPLEC